MNLRQIGFVKPAKYPCAPLMLKTFFILMFWSTMRQLFREQLEKRRSATLANIVAPLQLSVGAATAGKFPISLQLPKVPRVNLT